MARWVYKNRASAVLYEYLKTFSYGHHVLVPGNICPIVLATLYKSRANIIVVDLSEHNYLMDLVQVRGALSSLAGASASLLFVRTYGFLDNQNDSFVALKNEFRNLSIIDDRCLCPPEFDESKLSSAVDLTLFSTGYSKFVELGRGGVGFTRRDTVSQTNKGYFSQQAHENLVNQFSLCLSGTDSFNYQDSDWLDLRNPEDPFSNYRKEVLTFKPASLNHKKFINNIYKEKLSDHAEIYCFDESYQYWRFNVLVNNKQKILNAIFYEGLFASSHYSSVSPNFLKASTPVADMLHNNVVNLFNDFRMTEESAVKISDIILRECVHG